MRAEEVFEVVGRAGVVHVRDLRDGERTVQRLAAQGRLVRLLPGIYCLPSSQEDLAIRCAALMLWDPDAVITGLAAARLSFWTTASVGLVEFHSRRKRTAPPWARLHRSGVPPEDIVERGGIRMTRAAATAVHLAAVDEGASIDKAFFERVIRLPDLTEALGRRPGRHGNPQRRAVVAASRDEPWSQGERLLHKELRQAGILGWVANHAVRSGGRTRYLDVAFVAEKLVVEFDGREFHGEQSFESDRERQNELVRAGWLVLRVTWAMLQEPAAVMQLIAEVLQMRRQEREILARAA